MPVKRFVKSLVAFLTSRSGEIYQPTVFKTVMVTRHIVDLMYLVCRHDRHTEDRFLKDHDGLTLSGESFKTAINHVWWPIMLWHETKYLVFFVCSIFRKVPTNFSFLFLITGRIEF